MFRGEGKEANYTQEVSLGERGHYTPLPTLPGAPELNRVFSIDGNKLKPIEALQKCGTKALR